MQRDSGDEFTDAAADLEEAQAECVEPFGERQADCTTHTLSATLRPRWAKKWSGLCAEKPRVPCSAQEVWRISRREVGAWG